MIGAITAGLFGTGVAASTNSYESIATVTVGAGGQSSISFSSIPSTFKHLQIRAMARTTNTGVDNYGSIIFNGDTAANYTYHDLQGNGSTASATGLASQNANYLQRYAGAGAAASIFGVSVTDILDYQNTNKYKTIRNLGGDDRNGAGFIYLTSGAWLSTSAVTSITITPEANNWAQYSSFALYGIKG
jgi:hypothetical protein